MDPLKVLGLEPGTSPDKARSQYMLLCKQYHPDKNSDEYAEQQFKEISNAYKQIEENPSLLDRSPGHFYSGRQGETFQVNLKITSGDLFFGRTRSVKYKRLASCKKCHGTGSKSMNTQICGMCKGSGIVKGSIFRVVRSDNQCPECAGVGVVIPRDDVCGYCKGATLLPETTLQKVKLDIGYRNGQILIYKDGGNDGPFRGSNGGLYVKLVLEGDRRTCIRDKVLHIEAEISPAQHMLGDKISVDVFGKAYVCNIKPLDKEVSIAAAGNPVKVALLVKWPELTDKSRKLYERILADEKKAMEASSGSSESVP